MVATMPSAHGWLREQADHSNRYGAAWEFVHGQRTRRSAGTVYCAYVTLWTGGPEPIRHMPSRPAIFSYGEHFPMALRRPDGTILVNAARYSATTSKHQSALRHVLATAGYDRTGETVELATVGSRSNGIRREDGGFGHVWEVWSK